MLVGRMYQLVKPPTYRHIPCWRHTLLQILFTLHAKMDMRANISPHVLEMPHLGMWCRSNQLFLCILVYFRYIAKKHIWEWRVSGWMRRMMIFIMQIQGASMERVHLLLFNRIGCINLKDEKKGNCTPVIIKIEAEEEKTMQQGLDLNTLLA